MRIYFVRMNGRTLCLICKCVFVVANCNIPRHCSWKHKEKLCWCCEKSKFWQLGNRDLSRIGMFMVDSLRFISVFWKKSFCVADV